MNKFDLQKIEHKGWFRTLAIILGSAIVAFGLAAFLVPHRIVAGGTSGLSTIIYHLTGFPIGLIAVAIDVPLFIWAFCVFGFRFLLKTFAAALLMAGFLQVFNILMPEALAPDPLLSCLYGGLITGAGMGIIFRAGATTGGTDLIAAIFRRYFGWKLGTGLFLADGLIIALSGLIFGFDLILYGILTVFICTRVVDLVQGGTSAAKGVFIISRKHREIQEALYQEVARGITVLKGKGGYSGGEVDILFSVILLAELGKMKDTVYSVDPDAFVVVVNAVEAMGEGFVPITNKD